MTAFEVVNIGFLPLTDCMFLAVAREKGFALDQGIEMNLTKEQSWASIRDHMAVGHYDAAHMLAPMPIAFNAGLSPFSVPVIAPIALGLGGNAVTIGSSLWHEMKACGALPNVDAATNGAALRSVLKHRKKMGARKIRFAVVHPFSGHNFELRYWFSACGIDPDNDVEIIIVPPPLMPEALAAQRIDGFCVGEPWNSVAVGNGHGAIATTKSAIWRSSPEKILGVQSEFAAKRPDTLNRLLRSIYEAARWCGDAQNRAELSQILASETYVGVPAAALHRALNGDVEIELGQTCEVADFFIPFDRAATFPWQSHALWFYSQMVRWGQMIHTPENLQIAKHAYRPDLYRLALEETGAAIPSANLKVEGALAVETAVGSTGRLMLGPDGFFDNQIFDPEKVSDYIKSF